MNSFQDRLDCADAKQEVRKYLEAPADVSAFIPWVDPAVPSVPQVVPSDFDCAEDLQQ